LPWYLNLQRFKRNHLSLSSIDDCLEFSYLFVKSTNYVYEYTEIAEELVSVQDQIAKASQNTIDRKVASQKRCTPINVLLK
jgi:hypothetical protein